MVVKLAKLALGVGIAFIAVLTLRQCLRHRDLLLVDLSPLANDVQRLAIAAMLMLVGLYGAVILTVRLALLAARRGHTLGLRLCYSIAPRTVRTLLGSALTGSLLLTALPASQPGAWGLSPQSEVTLVSGENTTSRGIDRLAAPNETLEAPSPQWLPHRVSVPISRLISEAPQAKKRSAEPPETVVVAGDSLWSIAAKHLGAQATVADIAAYWPQIYRTNRDRIGADPDVLRIGTTLQLPTPPTIKESGHDHH
ncbi:LysM domain-containing protein [Glutamicibacter sp. PS]|uniref:LysM peptidoglycan-binding domain-containing protein n=1 Tax=Glutamicibacter sp. PS TaxID=3075634 RepID=UPI0028409943|nr:LysM domain-containing protein [Glutamicibacter sp. PS]MDR4532392.1 LysM peptidoglycan-binding domain-containing protein [Glutamicibacter sp. PS]